MFASKKLKDPRTCRIFFSSPFGGMEEEREELTRKYFPQIHHLCNGRGIQFVPVDMRWGITEEAAENAQVLNICLRELDRSDIFVGFFGQRYGWHSTHGGNYDLLQNNFENAEVNYPWLNNYHDRSITEAEFLHGHLNNPGGIPACICFRSKKFDEDKYNHYLELGDERKAIKYLSEGKEATHKLENLKMRIEKTKDKCLALHMDYKDPHTFATIVFDALWKYLNEILEQQTDLTARTKMLLDHDTFMSSRQQLYVGGDAYFQQLDDYWKREDKYILLSGPAGSGKSALLSNWVGHLKKMEEELIVIYHFIGSGADSGKPLDISLRLKLEAEHALEMVKDKEKSDVKPEESREQENKEIVEKATDKGEKSSQVKVRENLNKFKEIVEELTSKMDKKVVLVVDAVEKSVDDSGKVTKPLYWLPDKLPKGVFIVVSSLDSNKIAQEELVGKRHYETLYIEPLAQQTRHEICVKILQKSGKAFSAQQLEKVVNSEQTTNPLFLLITIHELSVFGYFRKLDEKIESLLACESIQQLFDKYLERMEEDYNMKEYSDNLVKNVFSALYVANEGLSENELQEAFSIPKHVFSPLYFAMDKFIVSHSGPLWFAFSKLRDAIKERYLQTEEDRVYVTRKLIEYFEKKRKSFCITMKSSDKSTVRLAYELPWLQKSIGDKEGLARSLVDLFIFSRLYQERDYELLELWKSTGYNFMEYGQMFEKEFDRRLVEYYLLYVDGATTSEKPPAVELLIYLEMMEDFLDLALCKPACIQISLRIIKILNNLENVNNYEDKSRQKKLAINRYQLACSYCDTERYQEAEQLHHQVLEYFKKALESGDLERKFAETRMGWIYNGLGLAARAQCHLDEAKKLLQQSYDVHEKYDNKHNMADSLQNMALVFLDMKEHKEAVRLLKRALKLYEDKFFGTVPHIIGNLLTNLGLCYRRMNDLDSAEKYYFEALRVKANAVGWDHPIIATNYMNLGTLEMNRKNWSAAEEYAKKCIEIYKINLYPDDDYHHRRALENLLMVWMIGKRFDEEVQELYWHVYDILVSLNEMDHCLSGVHHRMAKHFIASGRLEDANKILVTVMGCKKRNKTTYLHMDELDSLWPDGQKPQRPMEMTLDYARDNLYKDDGSLNNRKLEKYLVPKEDVQGIFKCLEDSEEDFTSEDYTVMAEHCVTEMKGTLRLGINILLEGLKVCPESQQIVAKLVHMYYNNNQSQEAFPYLQEILDGKYSKFKQNPVVSRFSREDKSEKKSPDDTAINEKDKTSQLIPGTEKGKTSEDTTSGKANDKMSEDGKDNEGKASKGASSGKEKDVISGEGTSGMENDKTFKNGSSDRKEKDENAVDGKEKTSEKGSIGSEKKDTEGDTTVDGKEKTSENGSIGSKKKDTEGDTTVDGKEKTSENGSIGSKKKDTEGDTTVDGKEKTSENGSIGSEKKDTEGDTTVDGKEKTSEKGSIGSEKKDTEGDTAVDDKEKRPVYGNSDAEKEDIANGSRNKMEDVTEKNADDGKEEMPGNDGEKDKMADAKNKLEEQKKQRKEVENKEKEKRDKEKKEKREEEKKEKRDEEKTEKDEEEKTLAWSYIKCGLVAIACESPSIAEQFFNKAIAFKVKDALKSAQEAIEKYDLNITDENLNVLIEFASDPSEPKNRSKLDSDPATTST